MPIDHTLKLIEILRQEYCRGRSYLNEKEAKTSRVFFSRFITIQITNVCIQQITIKWHSKPNRAFWFRTKGQNIQYEFTIFFVAYGPNGPPSVSSWWYFIGCGWAGVYPEGGEVFVNLLGFFEIKFLNPLKYSPVGGGTT